MSNKIIITSQVRIPSKNMDTKTLLESLYLVNKIAKKARDNKKETSEISLMLFGKPKKEIRIDSDGFPYEISVGTPCLKDYCYSLKKDAMRKMIEKGILRYNGYNVDRFGQKLPVYKNPNFNYGFHDYEADQDVEYTHFLGEIKGNITSDINIIGTNKKTNNKDCVRAINNIKRYLEEK